jgi:hypothetical protein
MSRAEIAAEIANLPHHERRELMRLFFTLAHNAESLDAKREDLFRAAEANLVRAYGPDEPEYGPEQIVELKRVVPLSQVGH